ncbi:MAG: hypothetical protein ACLRXB_08805 [Escherichia coli]
MSPGKTLGSLSLAVTPASLNSGALTTVDETLLADAEQERLFTGGNHQRAFVLL